MMGSFMHLFVPNDYHLRLDHWSAQVLSEDALLVLFINYLFFSMIILLFISFIILLTQTSTQIDLHAVLSILVGCFMFMNIIIANYVVFAMQIVSKNVKHI